MGRPRKGADLEEKIQKYTREYELDDLNSANDMASLVQMCQLEINMEQIQDALKMIKDPVVDSKRVRDLHASLKDANTSWTNLQSQLGIDRRKRQSEDEETPLQYIDRLKDSAKKFIEERLITLKCKKCGLPIAKYHIYVKEKGEPGSIAYKGKQVELIKYTIRVECPVCNIVTEVSNENK
jgi:hypothetical protein